MHLSCLCLEALECHLGLPVISGCAHKLPCAHRHRFGKKLQGQLQWHKVAAVGLCSLR